MHTAAMYQASLLLYNIVDIIYQTPQAIIMGSVVREAAVYIYIYIWLLLYIYILSSHTRHNYKNNFQGNQKDVGIVEANKVSKQGKDCKGNYHPPHVPQTR